MGLTTALVLGALLVAAMAGALLFAVACTGVRRGITSGPTVTFARGLFLVVCAALAIVVVCLFWGVATGWV